MRDNVTYSLVNGKNIVIMVSSNADIGTQKKQTPDETIEKLINTKEMLEKSKPGLNNIEIIDSKIVEKVEDVSLNKTKKKTKTKNKGMER